MYKAKFIKILQLFIINHEGKNIIHILTILYKASEKTQVKKKEDRY